MISTFIGSGVTLISGSFLSFVLRIVGDDPKSLKMVMVVGDLGSVRFVEEVKRISTWNIETVRDTVYKVCGWETKPLSFPEVEKKFYTSLFFNVLCRHTYTYGASELYHHSSFQEKIIQMICPNCRQVTEKVVVTKVGETVSEERFSVRANREVYKTENVIVHTIMEDLYKVSVCPYTYFSFNEVERKHIDTTGKRAFNDIELAKLSAIDIDKMRKKFIARMAVH